MKSNFQRISICIISNKYIGWVREILQLSKETEHPRAYEVAGQLIKTVGETAEKLIDLQQKLKKLEGEDQKIGQQHNHLYVGSTSELQKFLKKNDKK